MKNKILISILMFFVSVIALGSLSYAYFAYKTTLDLTTISAAKPVYITVNSEYEMHKVIYDPVDNASATTSKNRYAVKLGASIKLTDDMIVTRDIALDLDIYDFDLNGHTLKILHTYNGKSVITNNTIGLDTGNFINTNDVDMGYIDISTPNVEIDYDLLDLIELDASIEVLPFSEERLVDDVYQFVKSRMFSYYWHDLALPTHYFNYDLVLDYNYAVAVVDPDIDDYINKNGHVTRLPDVKKDAVMTLTISSPTLISEIHAPLEVPFTLLSGKPASTYYDERMAAAEKELLAYLDYYKWGLSGNNYYIYNNLQLPNLGTYFGLKTVYSATSSYKNDDDETIVLPTGDLSIVNGHTVINKYNLDTGAGQRTITLKVDYTFDEGGTLTVVSHSYLIHVIANSNYDIASQIIEDIGLILVVDGEFILPTFNELEEYGIKSVTYSVESEYFELTGDDLNVISLLDGVGYPPITEKEYLTITFEFLANTPLVITSQTRIYCENYGSGGEGEVYDQYFDAYYDLHSRLVSYLNGGTRLSSFQMPDSTLYRNVTYGLIRTSELPQDLTTISLDGRNSITLGNGDVLAYIDDSTDGYSEIVINFENIPLTDTNLTLLYCFNGTSWYGSSSSFTIPGVIRNDTILDTDLFNIVLGAYDANGDGILLTKEATAALPGPLVVSNVTISDWSGIEQLINLTELEIVNSSIDADGMTKIGKLARLRRLTISNSGVDNIALANLPKFERLVYLNLSHNNITDLKHLKVLPSLIELDVSHNEILELQSLISFPSLQDINVSHNQINYFDDLRKIANLKTVRLYNNIKAGDDDALYGSIGAFNTTSFTILARNKVDVYYRLDGTDEILFEPTDNQTRGTEILEAISYTSNGNGPIELTVHIYNIFDIFVTVNYTGDDFNFTAPNAQDKIYATIKPERIVPGKTYYIVASVVVGGTTVYRVLEVVMPV